MPIKDLKQSYSAVLEGIEIQKIRKNDALREIESKYIEARGVVKDYLVLLMGVLIALFTVPIIYHKNIEELFLGSRIFFIYLSWILLISGIISGISSVYFSAKAHLMRAEQKEFEFDPEDYSYPYEFKLKINNGENEVKSHTEKIINSYFKKHELCFVWSWKLSVCSLILIVLAVVSIIIHPYGIVNHFRYLFLKLWRN